MMSLENYVWYWKEHKISNQTGVAFKFSDIRGFSTWEGHWQNYSSFKIIQIIYIYSNHIFELQGKVQALDWGLLTMEWGVLCKWQETETSVLNAQTYVLTNHFHHSLL